MSSIPTRPPTTYATQFQWHSLIYNVKHYSLTCENNKLTVSLAASIAPLSLSSQPLWKNNKLTVSLAASIAPVSLSGQPLRRIPKIQQNHIIFVFLLWNGRTGKSRTPFSCSNDFLRPNSQEVSNLEPLISGKWRALRKWHFQYITLTRKCIFGAKCVQGVIWRDLKLVCNADLHYAPGREIHLFFKGNQRFAR